jgi:hypothetical protein
MCRWSCQADEASAHEGLDDTVLRVIAPAWEARSRAYARQVPALGSARAKADAPTGGCVILIDQREMKNTVAFEIFKTEVSLSFRWTRKKGARRRLQEWRPRMAAPRRTRTGSRV